MTSLKVRDLTTRSYCILTHLGTAHREACKRGITHRDISAQNVLIVRDDEGRLRGLLADWDLCFVKGYAAAEEQR